MDSARTGPSDASSSLGRASVLPLVRLPSLKRCDEGRLHRDKPPLLILRLSSPSFLHATIEDETRLALYTIKTTANLTTVMRSDPWEGMTKIADVRWPENPVVVKGKAKKSNDVQVQMRGHRWVNGESFLRTGSGSSAPRKFTIPNYSHTLKWRQVGSSFWCTTPSVKGPIVILEPASPHLPPQLQIFETFHDRYDGRPMMDHQGVSILLLDYILTTALLLATDVQEWTSARNDDHIDFNISHTDTPDTAEAPRLSQGAVALTSTSQWRKIMYGEPIYPKRHAHSASCSSPSTSSPTSADGCAKMMNRVPKISSALNFSSSSESDPEDEGSFSSLEQQGPTTPALRSILYKGRSEPVLSHISFNNPFYPGDPVELSHPTAPISATSRSKPFQSRSSTLSSPSVDSPEAYQSPGSCFSRSHSTPPQALLSPEGKNLPPVPGPSSSRNIRSPSLPVDINLPTSGRSYGSRPLPQPPDASSNSPRALRYARSQQGLGSPHHGEAPHYGSYTSRALPLRPPQPPLSPFDARALVPALDAGPLTGSSSLTTQQLFSSPLTPSPRFQFPAPFTHATHHHRQKTPDDADLIQWMGRLGMASRPPAGESPALGSPYDVPPPAYDSINFDE